ncbi:MAG: helix-turn-helix transcriptional regulator [Nitrospirota bacterium]|jgi:transcriptional regulator with XRE-family HTH domain
MKPRTFAMNVKRLRARGGLTQSEVAKKARISRAYIAQLETGEQTNPTLATLRRLAKGLKVSVWELLD